MEDEKPSDDVKTSEVENTLENDQEVIGEIEEKEWTIITKQVETLQEATSRLMDKIIEIEDRLEKPVETATETTENESEDLSSEIEEIEELTMTPPEQPPISTTANKKKPLTKKINLFKRA